MFQTIIISSLVVASLSILWRSTLNKIPHSREKIKKALPFFFGTAITCGLCFTYWLAFFFVIMFNPFSPELFPFNNFESVFIKKAAHFLISWMIIGLPAVFLRFLFALIQEKVNYMNEINGHGHHHSHTH